LLLDDWSPPAPCVPSHPFVGWSRVLRFANSYSVEANLPSDQLLTVVVFLRMYSGKDLCRPFP
jgi:hypothetical protein